MVSRGIPPSILTQKQHTLIWTPPPFSSCLSITPKNNPQLCGNIKFSNQPGEQPVFDSQAVTFIPTDSKTKWYKNFQRNEIPYWQLHFSHNSLFHFAGDNFILGKYHIHHKYLIYTHFPKENFPKQNVLKLIINKHITKNLNSNFNSC